MRPITIADLQESSDDYKRNYANRRKEYMVKTEATEKEFVAEELDAWERIHYDLHLMKAKENNPWYHLESEELEILSEAIRIEGFDKMYFSAKRKLEFLETQNSKVMQSGATPSDEDKEVYDTQQATNTPTHNTSLGNKPKEIAVPKAYNIIHIAIACFCLEIDLTSVEGKRLVNKYTTSAPGDSLYKEKYQIAEVYFHIVRNKKVDNAKKRAISAAKGLIKKLNNKRASGTITELQSTFEKEYISYYK